MSKDKGKLQTPKKIQLPTWKKTRVESPTNPSYHYIPGSIINITFTGVATSNMTSAFGQFSFQSKQKKAELLKPYGIISDLWEVTKSEEEEEEETKDQEFTYQNPITKNLEFETPNLQTQQNLNPENPEIKTPNIQTPPTQDNQNSNLINQQNLPPVIPPQQSNLDPMVYTPIAKLDNFTGKENNAQIWLNDIEKAIVANGWNDEDATTNNSEFNPPQTTLTNNIPPATVTENESLAAIFPFELEEIINPLLFSRAALEEKPITTMYTDAKVDGHSIKLILDSRSADSIITRQLMDQLGHQVDHTASTRIITADEVTKTPIGEINDFPIEVNGIIILIKVLIIEATQY
ncbi:hypothetical protein G9A89_007922 [Geosiphon pyriformis]|nr:hypothetical protein G9A89_007922 [Geosiphon pyriformis]